MRAVSCVCGRTEFLSRRGKEPKAAGGRRGFLMRHAGPRTPADKYLMSRGASQGRPERGSLRFRTNGPVANVPFSTMGLCLGAGRRWRVKDALCAWNLLSGGTHHPKKASPERGSAREAGGGVRVPHAARSRRLCQPPGRPTTRKTRKRAHLTWARKPGGMRKPISQLLFGRGGLGERRFS